MTSASTEAVQSFTAGALTVTGAFKATPRLLVREHSSLITKRSTRKGRRLHHADGPDGHGQAVMLIPGFMSGDWSMAGIARALKSWNFQPARAGLKLNIDCTEAVVETLEKRLITLAERHDSKIALVGWSRGGTLGKLISLRRPDLVEGLITLASPNVNPLAVNSLLARQINLLLRASDRGLQHVLNQDCVHGECGARMRTALETPMPAGIPYVSVYTPHDGVIDWHAALDPSARHIEVQSTHLAIGNEPRVQRLVGNLLAEFPADGN